MNSKAIMMDIINKLNVFLLNEQLKNENEMLLDIYIEYYLRANNTFDQYPDNPEVLELKEILESPIKKCQEIYQIYQNNPLPPAVEKIISVPYIKNKIITNIETQNGISNDKGTARVLANSNIPKVFLNDESGFFQATIVLLVTVILGILLGALLFFLK